MNTHIYTWGACARTHTHLNTYDFGHKYGCNAFSKTKYKFHIYRIKYHLPMMIVKKQVKNNTLGFLSIYQH